MKHNFKRVLALLLAVVMCMTCTLPVFASDAEKVTCPGANNAKAHTDAYEAGNYDNATEVKVVTPTCGVDGYTVRRCNECGAYFMTDILLKAEGCEWGEPYDVVPATCTENGSQKVDCLVHGKTYEQELPATGHTWGDWVNSSDALCTEGGVTKSRTCQNCDAVDGPYTLDAEEHTWVIEITKVPTCDTEGTAKYTCSVCGFEKILPILTMGEDDEHDWVLIETKTEGCYEVEYYACETCRETKKVVTDRASHDFENGEVVPAKDPTCFEKGHTEYTKCANCDAVDGYEEIDMLDHDWEIVERKEPKCGVEAGTSYKCKNEGCDATKWVPDPDEYQVGDHLRQITYTEATCTYYGQKITFCPRCGFQDVEAVAEPYYHHLPDCENHVACLNANGGISCAMVLNEAESTEPDCTNAGKNVYYCSLCDHKQEKENATGAGAGEHKYEKIEHVKATCVSDGEYRWKCEVCGEFELDENDEIKVEVIKASDEYHAIVTEIATPATCTLAGLKITFCKLCDKVDTKREIYYMEHEVKDGTLVVTSADCLNDGSESFECKNCGEIITKTLPATGHNIEGVEWTVTPATCAAAGVQVKICKTCGQVAVSEVLPALEHTFDSVEPTLNCENQSGEVKNVCSVCGHTEATGVIKTLTHEELALAKSHVCDATLNEDDSQHRPGNCQHVGLWSYICPNMPAESNTFYVEDEKTALDHPVYGEGSKYYNADGTINKETVPSYITIVSGSWVAPTCTTLGKTEQWSCAYCDAVGGGEDIEMLPHDLTFVEAKDPTCTAAGNLAYYYCEDCDAYFLAVAVADLEASVVEVPKEETVLYPEGHDFYEETVDLTCTQDGEIWQKCHECDYAVRTGYTAAEGHKWVEVAGDCPDATCDSETSYGYVHMICTNKYCNPTNVSPDYKEFLKDFAFALEHDWVLDEVDCFNGDKYVCANNAEHTKTEESRGGHKNAAGQLLTCQKNDEITDRVCAGCGAYISDEHDYVNHPENLIAYEYEATCNKYAYTIWACPNCDWFEEVESSIKVFGDHVFGGYTNIVPANCTEAGSKDKLCSSCGEVYETEVIPATGHDNVEDLAWVETKPATCMEAGVESKICHCGFVLATQEIAKLEHNFVQVEYVAPQIATPGYEVLDCSNDGCDEKVTNTIEALDGIKFSYSYDNAVVSGMKFVNTGRIAVTITFETKNVTLNSILLALDFDANVLAYVDTDFTCDETIFVDCETGYDNETGNVSISAVVNTDAEANKDVELEDGTYALAVLYFDIKDEPGYSHYAAENANLELTPVLTGDQRAVVANKDAVAIAANFGSTGSHELERLGDINDDGVVDNLDVVELLNLYFADGYSAQADINQNGKLDVIDIQLLKQFAIVTISYEQLCAGEAA